MILAGLSIDAAWWKHSWLENKGNYVGIGSDPEQEKGIICSLVPLKVCRKSTG